MTEKSAGKQIPITICPHCKAQAGSSFNTVVKYDDNGPLEILYKCWSCGAFYKVKRVTRWEVEE